MATGDVRAVLHTDTRAAANFHKDPVINIATRTICNVCASGWCAQIPRPGSVHPRHKSVSRCSISSRTACLKSIVDWQEILHCFRHCSVRAWLSIMPQFAHSLDILHSRTLPKGSWAKRSAVRDSFVIQIFVASVELRMLVSAAMSSSDRQARHLGRLPTCMITSTGIPRPALLSSLAGDIKDVCTATSRIWQLQRTLLPSGMQLCFWCFGGDFHQLPTDQCTWYAHLLKSCCGTSGITLQADEWNFF